MILLLKRKVSAILPTGYVSLLKFSGLRLKLHGSLTLFRHTIKGFRWSEDLVKQFADVVEEDEEGNATGSDIKGLEKPVARRAENDL